MKKFNFLGNLLRREFAMSGMKGMSGLRADAVNSDSQPMVNRQSRLTSEQRHYSVTSARVAQEWLKDKLVNLVKMVMQIFVESAESAKPIFATFATFASANFVGKESNESTVRYRESSRIPSCCLRYGLDSHLSRLCLASLICLCMLTVGSGNVWGAALGAGYTKITSISSLSAGDKVVLYCDDASVGVTGYSGSDATVAASGFTQFDVEKSSTNYYFKSGTKYIKAQSSNKFTIDASTASGNECTVNASGVLCINSRYLVKNSSYYRMYTSIGSYKPFYVYKVTSSTPSITPSVTELDWGTVNKGASLSTKTFTITGTNLTSANLVYSASGGYSVSPSGKNGAAGTLSSQTLTVTPPSTATPGTYNSTVSISGGGLSSAVTVAVKLVVQQTDEFIDEVQSTSGYTSASPHIEGGTYSTPKLTDKSVATSGTCEQQHYHFVGWITKTKYDAGTSIAAGDIQTPTTASGATYYAVWAKQGAGSGSGSEELTSSELTTNITNTACAYGTEKTYTDNSKISYAFGVYTDAASRKWVQMKKADSGAYIEITAPGNISQVDLTVTAAENSSGGVNDISKHTKLPSTTVLNLNTAKATDTSKRVAYVAGDGSSTSRSIVVSSPANKTLYLQPTGGACRIWGITVYYSTVTYTDSIAKCCNELASINGSVSWSSVSSSSSTATLSWANNSNVNSYSVTCTASGASAGTVGSITGTTTKSCAVTGLAPGTEYTFTINATGKSGYCDASQEIAAKAPKITAGSISGTSIYIYDSGPGSVQTFSVSGAGLTGNLTVAAPTNFQVSTDNGSTWSTSGGSKTITVSTPPSDLASTTIKIRLASGLAVNNYGPSDVTISGGDAASVTVAVSGTVSPACEDPTIGTHPATPASAYRIGVTATALSVAATKNGSGPALTYQWYSNSSDNNTSGELIDGATSSSYTPPTSSPGTVYYYCEVSSGACMTASNCAAITVSTPTITVSETSRAFGTKAKDSSSTMTFTVSGSDLGANIGLAISGTNAAMFSIDKTSLTHSSGTVSTQTITVTYNPTAVGSHTAQINITSTGATTKTVSLSGTGAWPVEWYVGGTDSDYKLTSGSQSTLATNGSNVSALTFPTSSQTTIECGGKTFVGWTNTSSYTHGTSPLFTQATATGTITSAVKYYAVFAEANVNSEELTESEIKSQFTTASHKYDDSDVSYTDGDVTWNAKYNVDATDRPWIQFNNTAYMQITAPGKITKVELIVTSTSNKSGGIADKTQYNAFGSAVTLSLLTATSAGTNVGSSTTNTEDSYQEITINVSSGDNTSLYLMSSAAYRLWGITVTYGGYSDHLLTCTTCNKVTVSYSDPSHATLSVKKSAAVISSGTQVSTCSSQTLTVKVTPDAANHYWMTAMSISGVTGVTTDPSTTSGLPTKEQKSYSVTIPKDATGTLIITPTIEAIPQKTISFLVNGDDAEDNSPQDIYVGEKPELPTVPDDNELSCAEAFVGWSTNELTETGNAEPADLFFTSTATPTVTDDVTYHAVFASKDGSKSGKYTLDYSDETSLSGSSSWGYGTALEYTATDGSTWAVKAYKNSGMQINTGKDCSIKIPDCPSGATITTIEITGSTSKAVGISASDYSGSGTITYIATGTDATSQILDLRGLEVTGGYIVPKSGSIVITKIVVNYAKYKDYMTYCTKIFTDAAGADHNWSTAGNWSGGVPTIKDRARIQKPVTVDVATAKAKNVVLDQSGSPTKTGQLILDAGKELTVAETVRKTTDGSTYSATGEDDIVFNSTSSAGLGALVVGSHDGTNQATVNFYSKSHGSKNSNESVNQFVGTPFNDANVLYNWYNSWIYEFTNTSGTASWKRIKDGDEMTPFHGYCVISADNEMNPGHMYWQQGTLVASEDQNLTLKYFNDEETENMFANSWMAPIKISEMNGHMTNTTGTIYIFNSGSAMDGDGSLTDGSAGNYSTYTPGTAGSNVIPAMQAFTVYATAAGSLSLDYSAYVYDPAVAGTTPVANKAPQRAGTAEDEMEHLKLRVACENGWGDALDIYIREDFSEGFEMYYDGPKIEGDEQAPMLYAVTDDGKMAINCVPDAEGTVVGFRRGEDAYYQFTFDYEGDEVLYLNDLKEQISTPISMDRSYTFTSAAGDMQARFIISRTPIHNTPTGVEDNSQRSKVESRKLLIDDHVFIIRNGQIYDVTGIRVRESNK